MPDSSRNRDSAGKEIDIEHWRETPCILHRLATEDDAHTGRAVFCVPNPSESESKPVDVSLPRCALLTGNDGQVSPVILVQAETHRAGEELVVLIGYTTLAGEQGICTIKELELLDGPDRQFYPRLTGLSLTLENRPPLLAPTLPDVRSAVDSLTPDGGPGFLVLEAEAGDYVQAAGGDKAFTAEWREYSGEQFQHWVAGTRGLPGTEQIRIRTNGAAVTVNENERLQSADVKAIVEAFANREQRPPAYTWRDIAPRFK